MLPASLSAGAVRRGLWSAEVHEASRRFDLPEEWIAGVITVESGGRELIAGRPITSKAGAMGLMQLMPETWAEMRDIHRLGPNPFDARDNILAGTAYLRAMYKRFGYPGLFAAYNAGPSRYARFLQAKEGLPSETVLYLSKISRCGMAPRSKPACGAASTIDRQRRIAKQDTGLFVISLKGGASVAGVTGVRPDALDVIRLPR